MIVSSNLSSPSDEVVPVIIFNNTNLINFFSNCCTSTTATTEPNFTKYLQELPSDRVSLLIFLILFSFATVFGNSLVILAVIRERYLHTSTNYFVTSLAVADCLVGLVVMPFSALYEVLQNTWFFGTDWCDFWRSLDVLFSTASILNLCVISLDRYWAITGMIIKLHSHDKLMKIYIIHRPIFVPNENDAEPCCGPDCSRLDLLESNKYVDWLWSMTLIFS